MPFGYNGRILRIDLTAMRKKVEEPGDILYRTYLGGGGLAAYYLLKELGAGVDPLGPENILIFASSIVSGVPMAGLARYTVSAKSPLTGGYGQADAGGYWGPELKFSGYDAIIIKGRSEKPAYLWIHDGKVELRSAEEMWGMESGPAQQAIREDLREKRARVAVIGPAGENLVRYAGIVNDLHYGNGRTGMGAVMGSKNLKAIAVQGKNRLEVKNLEKFLDLSNRLTELISSHEPNQVLSKLGTSNLVLVLNQQGILPTRNFHTGVFAGADKISGEKMAETMLKSIEGCYACAGGCKRRVEDISSPYPISPLYGGPEYETIAALGSLLGIDDLGAICKGNELCARYGLDPISTGGVIAFAMECFENQLLSLEETEGVEFHFGNASAMLQAIEWITHRKKGLGDILANGVKEAACKIGRGAEKFALHVKGQELPMHDPRGKAGLALALAASSTGADHMEVAHDPPFSIPGLSLDRVAPLGLLETVPTKDLGPRKIRNYMYLQLIGALYDSLGVCPLSAGPVWALPLNQVVELINTVTGWETSLWELLKAGERAIQMSRVFNIREGFGHRDDILPERLFEPLENGPLEGISIERPAFAEALKMYYEAMGWDGRDGIPTRGKLAELNLSWLDEYLAEKRPGKAEMGPA